MSDGERGIGQLHEDETFERSKGSAGFKHHDGGASHREQRGTQRTQVQFSIERISQQCDEEWSRDGEECDLIRWQKMETFIVRQIHQAELHGTDTEEETNTSMPTAFLMEQMEWRERVARAYENANDGLLDSVAEELAVEQSALLGALRSELDRAQWPAAALTVRKLRFLEKLGEEIETARDALEV